MLFHLSSPTPRVRSLKTPTLTRIIFFDGGCNLCNFWVRFLVRRDSRQKFLYAPLEGATARQKLPAPMVEDRRSIVFYEKGRIFTGAEAVGEIARHLPFPWRLLSLSRFLPFFLKEGLYRLIASKRHKIFGKGGLCHSADEADRNRFLD